MNEFEMGNVARETRASEIQGVDAPEIVMPDDGISLPKGWSFICPNRIKENRLAVGYETVSDLQREMKTISYARLRVLETGKVFVRDSEYELIAQYLAIHPDDLRLPLLSQEETIKWADAWSGRHMYEEGGDKDSVILAAYVRKSLRMMGETIGSHCVRHGFHGHMMAQVVHAERRVTDWSFGHMEPVSHLVGEDDWDKVLKMSQTAYEQELLGYDINKVREPRLRFEPLDPDKRAPWTYETDPLRKIKNKRPANGFHLKKAYLDLTEEEKGKMLRMRQEARQHKEQILEVEYGHIVRKAIHGNQYAQLTALFPHDTHEKKLAIMKDKMVAATIIARAILSRKARKTVEINAAAKVLNVKPVKLRNMMTADYGRITNFEPKGNYAFEKVAA